MSDRSPSQNANPARTAKRRPPRRPSNVARRFEHLLRGASGNVTIEFGILILILVTLAIGAFDFGRLGYRKIAITSAARAGAQYGTQDLVTAADTAGMTQAARNDIRDAGNALNITARQYCDCPGQGEVACTVTCNDGSYSLMYVEVTVPDQVNLLFPYPGITSPRAVVSISTMRVR
ncbi:MAG: pilus assembly protein [Proteobacteria bacterium]|nr:pilus assembly protein [Pseudomonadota bacterium]